MNDSIIKIDISYFQDRYNQIEKIPENIKNKAVEINDTYSCFKSYYDPKMIWVKKNYNKKEKNVSTKNRFHIIIPDFTDNSMLKRKLVGLLNKITTKNKNTIYESIKEIINANDKNSVFEIIWEYIKLNENILYTNILTFFDENILQENIEAKWNNYIEFEEWKPPKKIYDNDILLLNDEYDLYCDYIKWKKNINNLNKLWLKFKLNEIYVLLEVLFENTINILKENKEYKHILDIFLEQLFNILSVTKTAKIINKIKNIDISKFNNSTKFLIYNILELQNK
mgnify:CR=1 FL=1|tara:strand:- start:89 stop:934 length:846 start_codon:yes stop_codon:yes gene_type:complete